jgi:hypothetical protein
VFVAIGLSGVLICQWAQAQTFSVEQIERRIVIGFQVNAETLLRMNSAEFADLFNGSEQLVGINLLPWYNRQVYIR